MTDLLPHKAFYKKAIFVQVIFCCITLLMVITRFASLYTYNGADDLHYAFLSKKLLSGSYDMFFANDIFSARLLPVLHQALWFKLFGINDFSMSMPSLTILIVLAYFVCFKCGLQKNIATIIAGSSLIYFNPVVITATSGNLPDVYIALIALLVFLTIKKNTGLITKKNSLLTGIFAGLLLFAGLFVKESIVLIYAAAAIALVWYRSKIPGAFLVALLTVLFIGGGAYLCMYYVHTGNAFYHLVQVNNSAYFNPCSYNCLPQSVLLKRLTITVPIKAALAAAFPLLLLWPVVFAYKKYKNADSRFWAIVFLSLALLAMYFPFSVIPYAPLCHDMRQFFFLFPVATVLYLQHLQSVGLGSQNFRFTNSFNGIFFAMLAIFLFLYSPYNKWFIVCYALLAAAFTLNLFFSKKFQKLVLYFIMPLIFWLSIAYPLYKKPHDGYTVLKKMKSSLELNNPGNTYYFLNNDTRSHFALVNDFDTAKQFLNLDTVQNGFKPFIAYQQSNLLGTFKSGWLIVSRQYPEDIGAAKLQSINNLLQQLQPAIEINNTAAYYINSAEIIKELMHILNVKTGSPGCN